MDVAISKPLERRVSIVAGVNNLFNTAYEEPYAMPQQGRSVFAKIHVGY
jgi:outer membrane receptor protein involved in Fe transport